MPGYKHSCKYCGKLIPPDSNVCPLCGKVNPTEPSRCPGCRNPVETGWKNCSGCGLSLEIACPHCGEKTFFGDYCGRCGKRLSVVCKNKKCLAEQPPVSSKCVKCGKPL